MGCDREPDKIETETIDKVHHHTRVRDNAIRQKNDKSYILTNQGAKGPVTSESCAGWGRMRQPDPGGGGGGGGSAGGAVAAREGRDQKGERKENGGAGSAPPDRRARRGRAGRATGPGRRG
eukprot:3595662-Pyramimonas_sp.AAC.2